jgi:hypothetical protein
MVSFPIIIIIIIIIIILLLLKESLVWLVAGPEGSRKLRLPDFVINGS